MRSRTRRVYGSNSPKGNKTRSRPPIPNSRPLYHLDSLSKSRVSDSELVEMFQTFSDKNGEIIIESMARTPLNVKHLYKDGIASNSVKAIKSMDIQYNKKYSPREKAQREFVHHALLNELIKRDLINDNGSDSDESM